MLSDELIERPRAHPGSERCVHRRLGRFRCTARRCAEERTLLGHRGDSAQLLVGGTATMVGGSRPGASPSTLRSTCAAPSSPDVSAGTTSLALGLSANFVSVSSWRIATSVGSGAAALIEPYTVEIAWARPSASRI